MTPAQMKTGAMRAYGRKGWKTKLALDLGCNVCTVFRFMHREQIPPVFDVAIQGIFEQKKRQAEIDAAARKLLPRKFRYKKIPGKKK